MRLNESKQRFSIRKLTIGAASVLIGTTFYLASGQTVHADTVSEPAQTEKVENSASKADESSRTQVEQSSNADKSQTPVQDKVVLADKQTDNQTKQPSTDTQTDNKTEQPSTDESAAKQADTTKTPAYQQEGVGPVKYANNGGYDPSIWGNMDVNDWTLTGNEITGYSGDRTHIIIPNSSDFIKHGKLANGQTAEISSQTMSDLVSNTDESKATQSIAISLDDNSKIKAKDSDWSYIFSDTDLSNIQLANLDVSDITNMSRMFADTYISDLSSLANWNVGNVTNMNGLFFEDQISDLTPLANWNVSNVTNMAFMFYTNQIDDLTPLANWNVGNVTNMGQMFLHNQVSDLTPLDNWNVGNVTVMDSMFSDNQISDLTPLANWNVGNVASMNWMFSGNPIKSGDLSKWNFGSTSGMNNFIDAGAPAVIYLGDNSTLPSWFMQPKVDDRHYNNNIFTTSQGGHLIITSNPDLLANPNNAFNKVTFSDGTSANIPVFIDTDNNAESILNAVNKYVNQAIDAKKAELEKKDPNKVYTLVIDPSVKQNDPIALANAKIDIQATDQSSQTDLPVNGNDSDSNGDNSDNSNSSSNGESTNNASQNGSAANNVTKPTGNKTSKIKNNDAEKESSIGVKATSVDTDIDYTTKSSEVSSKQSANGNDNELPQTGEKETSTVSVFGLLAITLGGLMGLDADRKKKRN